MPGKRGALTFKQRDVSRAIRGAKKAGIDIARIEIDPCDGTFTIIPASCPKEIPPNLDKADGLECLSEGR
jgi:hypothetical protein